jgi:hypothetical protein
VVAGDDDSFLGKTDIGPVEFFQSAPANAGEEPEG